MSNIATHNDSHSGNSGQDEELPVEVRYHLAGALFYALDAMPSNPIEQRRMMVENDHVTTLHNGVTRQSRAARTTQEVYTGELGLYHNLTAGVVAEHMLKEQPELYDNSSRGRMDCYVRLEKDNLLQELAEDKKYLEYEAQRVKDFLAGVAERAGLNLSDTGRLQHANEYRPFQLIGEKSVRFDALEHQFTAGIAIRNESKDAVLATLRHIRQKLEAEMKQADGTSPVDIKDVKPDNNDRKQTP